MCLSTYEARFIFCRCFASLILNKQRGKREKVCARQLVIKNEMKLPSRKGEVRSLKKKKKSERNKFFHIHIDSIPVDIISLLQEALVKRVRRFRFDLHNGVLEQGPSFPFIQHCSLFPVFFFFFFLLVIHMYVLASMCNTGNSLVHQLPRSILSCFFFISSSALFS